MSPKWTASQQQALELRGTNLLVSAGAGSGKTTVLTHRILERIKNGDSITDFLVVTFTKASAGDLKRKLYEEITKLSLAEPNNKHYRTQTYELSGAHISTIHSYCLEIVRANFQTLGLSPKLRMADDRETGMIATEVMELVTDAFYESGSPAFHLLADTFSGTKDDAPLTETMLKLYGDLRAYTDYFGWLREKREEMTASATLLKNGADLFETPWGKEIRSRLREWFAEIRDAALELHEYTLAHTEDPNPLLTTQLWETHTEALYKAAGESYGAFLDAAKALGETAFPRMTFTKKTDPIAKDFISAERTRIKKETERILSVFAVYGAGELARQYEKMGEILASVELFLTRFEELYDTAKREKGILDFSDAEHFLLELLEQDGKPTPLCLSMQERIKEIYIDEYQDVSPLQDRLFTLLSNGNNRFMVGDVKQSIYRFRNAYPDIFLGYKDAYGDTKGEKEAGTRIFLRENFRSGQGVIDFTNLLFAHITADTPYQKEYKGEELIFQKATTFPKQPVTVAVSVSEERAKGKAVEREAAYVAEEILRLVESGTRETPEGGAPYRYRDIAILFRTLKDKTAPYEQALKERGIPYTVTTPQKFFDRAEIRLLVALLKALDDPTDDISLFASLRSPVLGFTDGELYTLRLESKRGSLFSALQAGGEREDALGDKCKNALAFLARGRETAEGKACHSLLWELYTENGLLHLCTRSEKSGLLMLYEYARTFENSGYKGLSGFISYLRSAEEKGVELPSFGEAGDKDCVTLTTIHRSKGLEYPAVFLSGGGQLLFPPIPKPYILLREKGLFFKLRDYDRLTVTNPLPNLYAGLLERDAELGEELRKLYVACTRAKEKLYITGAVTASSYEKEGFHRLAPTCMMDLVLYAVKSAGSDPCFELIEIAPEESGFHIAGQTPRRETEELFLTEAVKEAIRFRYPHPPMELPAKVSVSYLKETVTGAEREYSPEKLTRPPKFLAREAKKDFAAQGTANHTFLQFCDFDRVEAEGLEKETERLLALRMLDESQTAMLDGVGLSLFFQSDLYRRMRRGREVRREMRFSVRMEASELQAGAEGSVLLQGVIDCFFTDENGELVIVDYKTDRVRDPKELLERHSKQLELYAKAVEKITGKPVAKTCIWSFFLNKEVVFDRKCTKTH
ncbi:MAG: UvrD-helicase domain-containing protein [Clostridia bacterium]|nr:UvrD-helicase domain-containing protein [Clostridia bacterium]